MPEQPTERSNEEWVAQLTNPETQAQALHDLRLRLQRSLLYYLAQERSDLRHLPPSEQEHLAQDFAQDATLRVLQNLSYFRGESRFTTWANKIAVRLAISELRRARYKDFSLDDLTTNGEFLSANTNLVGSAPPNPERAAEQENIRNVLRAAFQAALTPRQYQALVAVALENVPMDVVAAQLGTNRNALYKLIHDARKKLRAYLEEQGLSTDYLLKLFEAS